MSAAGILLCGHGSRDADAIREFESVAERMRARLAGHDVAHGYLEFARPTLGEALDRMRERGARTVLAVPCMAFAAGHVKNDIPSVLNAYVRRHAVEIRFGRDLGVDARMMRAAGERLAEAESAADRALGVVPRHESLLVLVGRGTTDPDANSNIAKVARMLWEGMGFGWAAAAYSGVTFPLTAPALEHAARLGYRRIIVQPYFLFTGVLVKRIYRATAHAAERHGAIQFVKAPYLNDHPLVLDSIAARIEEIASGAGNMNCQLCKYREQVLGFEDEVGLPQASHHQHVEGIGLGDDGAAVRLHAHHHAHGLAHDHPPGDGRRHGRASAPGGHHPYPHSDHPLGPKSLAE